MSLSRPTTPIPSVKAESNVVLSPSKYVNCCMCSKSVLVQNTWTCGHCYKYGCDRCFDHNGSLALGMVKSNTTYNYFVLRDECHMCGTVLPRHRRLSPEEKSKLTPPPSFGSFAEYMRLSR